VFCKVCAKSYIARANDLNDHLKSEFHTKRIGNSQSSIESFCKGKEVARTEIIWAFLTVSRNLSLNLSDYMGNYFSHLTPNSSIAELDIINRKKPKISFLMYYLVD